MTSIYDKSLAEQEIESLKKAEAQKAAKKEMERDLAEFCLLAYNTFVLNESGRKLLAKLKEELFAYSGSSAPMPEQSRIYFMAGENNVVKRLNWSANEYQRKHKNMGII